MAEGGGSEDSEDRTLEPTQRRLDEAIKRGDVARSVEVNTWFVLFGLMLAVMITLAPASHILVKHLTPYLAQGYQLSVDSTGFIATGRQTFLAVMGALLLPLGAALFLALGGAMSQGRLIWTSEPLTPKFSKISPLAGFKRIFGKEAWVQFTKGLLKITIVGALCVYVLWSEHDRLESMARVDTLIMLPVMQAMAIKLLIGVLALFSVVAGVDYIYQRMTWLKRNRMTIKEMKEEFKESEGSPEIKAKVRQIRVARARKRMMANVPTATVVITNPTHFAIALKYESGMQAPVCIAKGVDSLALRIRKLAEDNSVAIVENPPLARALHASAEVDEEIPIEHYKAVAEVIGYVSRLRRRS
jgi:flagellar biosynthetic protein FlhB